MSMIPANSSGGAAANFQQQGQLDWVALSKSTVQVSIGALSRLSKGGVEAFTICVGKAICNLFAIQPAGQDLIHKSISKLQTFGGYGKVLWFGFGLKSIPEDLVETEQDLALCALCTSLSITYEKLRVAKVLRELCILTKAPEELTPSLHQWRSLGDLLAGVLLNSDFTLAVSTFHQIILPSCAPLRSDILHPPRLVSELAQAILFIGQVSKGDLVDVTFTGGLDCAWLAAFAEKILSLVIEIRNSSGYIHRFRSFSGTIQVFFNIEILEPQSRGSDLIVSGKSHRLSSGLDVFSWRDNKSLMSCLMVRSSWSEILHRTFPRDFEAILGIQGNPLGVYITCFS
jgi:hypothetical protein